MNSFCINVRQASRRGLSIMEVLFAIGVLTIGLLGVASILPVATNNASMALKTDRAVEEINNRVATEIAEIAGKFDEVVIANNSASSLAATGLRFNEVSTDSFGATISVYDKYTGASTVTQPNLPDAFVIDPWFLTAAGTPRADSTTPGTIRNGYDRTMYPCYDPRMHPYNVSPTDPIGSSLGAGPTYPKLVDLPRFVRVGLSFNGTSLLSAMNAEVNARRSDDFSILVPDDRTKPPGLFVQRSANSSASLKKNTVSSRFSSIVAMSRSDIGSNVFNAAVITMQDRKVVTVPGGYFDGSIVRPASGNLPAHDLRPYTAWLPDDPAAPASFAREESMIFPGEMVGYVSAAQRPISGGGGAEFIFRTSRYVKPPVRNGSWVMLMRREYVRDPSVFPGISIVPGPLKFAWYRVSDVVKEPAVVTRGGVDMYETQITVDGADWVFHPIQTALFATSTPPYYAQPYFPVSSSDPRPSWGTPPAFVLDDMPANGTDPPGYNHFDYGTTIVIAPDVVSVRQFQVRL
ncbi:hypothetical protein LOC67_13085 [Stieleria sp. JC731]|nr:hypothetical protein [Stieleria sp. JC731]MCC9601484.1 hypothetical protein [Stieleria sp. JC731]